MSRNVTVPGSGYRHELEERGERRVAIDLVSELENLLSEWVDEQICAGEDVPDFWDEMDTSKRLAKHLAQKGWKKG